MNVAETGVISRTCRVSLFQGLILRQPAGGEGGRRIEEVIEGRVKVYGCVCRGKFLTHSSMRRAASLHARIPCTIPPRNTRLSCQSMSVSRRSSSTTTKSAPPPKSYSNTLLLPKTKFKPWPDYASRDAILGKKTNEELYAWQVRFNSALKSQDVATIVGVMSDHLSLV